MAPALSPTGVSCEAASTWTVAAASNEASVASSAWSVMGRPEAGWTIYSALAAREIGTPCGVEQRGFAEALARWQAAHALPADGAMTADTLRAMDLVWLSRRPFVAATRHGACPPPPPEALLITLRPDEGYIGKAVRLQTEARAAYRRLVAAARSGSPAIGADPRLLTVVSGYRGPEEERMRCAGGAACGTPSMARCSAHRTGAALDLYLGAEPGAAPTSSDDASRARQTRSPAYRWLVAQADRFGFVPYPFEPWHWEFVGGD